jgi:hypothetical protein
MTPYMGDTPIRHDTAPAISAERHANLKELF